MTSGDDERRREQRRQIKNRVVALALGAFVILVFLVTLVRLGQQN